MLKALKMVRTTASRVNPDQVRGLSGRPLHIGLVAGSPAAYGEMEDFLVPAAVSHEKRVKVMEHIHREGDRDAPRRFDLVLSDGVNVPPGAVVLDRGDPQGTVRRVLREHEDLGLALARHFLPFRRAVVHQIVHTVSRENALFAVATSLPNVVPNLIQLPWALGEFASDTVFITANQVRMAFLVAAACDRDVGFADQLPEVGSIVAGAFGWRAIARQVAGKMPMGAGLIAKGAIAFAGTFVIGKGLEHFHHCGRNHTPQERRQIYRAALEEGREIARG
jgi:hypothetical protein